MTQLEHSSRTARSDPALAAVVVDRTPLVYTEGADAELDRPAHVRAGSSLAWVPGGIALIQDDANFIALFDPDTARTRAIPLPAGEAGRRQFDDGRGNKAYKLDLEACVAVEREGDTLLLALGSGSTGRREQVVIARGWTPGPPTISLVHLPRLYHSLRSAGAFAGSELNVEGAVHLGERVRLLGRGNGAAREETPAVNATCDLDAATLLAHLDAPDDTDPPQPTDVVRYDLGALGGVGLSFTDAAAWGDGVIYSAAAEESPDATHDGRVTGSAIGVIDRDGRARYAILTEASGQPFEGKVEGLLVMRGARDRLFVVLDADDPDAPSLLCTVELRGGW